MCNNIYYVHGFSREQPSLSAEYGAASSTGLVQPLPLRWSETEPGESGAVRSEEPNGVPSIVRPGHLPTVVARVPGFTKLVRMLFCFFLDCRRGVRSALRPFRRHALFNHRAVVALAWPWYRFRFRFSRVKRLRQAQFLVRDALGGGRRAVVSRHKLLLGGWNGMSGFDFALRAQKWLDPSTRLEDSFYVDLLSSYDRGGEAALTDDAIRASGYYQRIALAAALSGHYRGVSDPNELVGVAKEYVDRYRGRAVPYRPGRSRQGSLPRARRVWGSDCYTALDGHHRLAIAMHQGAEDLEVMVAPGTTTTYLQKVLLDMAWLDGSRRLYQPVPFPEVQSWPVMRRCDDRLAMMTAYLERAGLCPTTQELTYLDVGCCYGWFVAQMTARGFRSRGIEMDPLAAELAPLAHGLEPAQVEIGDCISLLADPGWSADVVSCFSVLHHFVLGRGSSDAGTLARLLSERTGKVLFLDTGQAHETWFRWVLPEWTPSHVVSWVLEHTSFTEAEALGTDRDGHGPFAGRFGRTLFAFSK